MPRQSRAVAKNTIRNLFDALLLPKRVPDGLVERGKDHIAIDFYMLGYAHAAAKVDARTAFEKLTADIDDIQSEQHWVKAMTISETQKKFADWAYFMLVESRLAYIRKHTRKAKQEAVAQSGLTAEQLEQMVEVEAEKFLKGFSAATASKQSEAEAASSKLKLRRSYARLRTRNNSVPGSEAAHEERISKAFSNIPATCRLSRGSVGK
jgi:hypothetical protein